MNSTSSKSASSSGSKSKRSFHSNNSSSKKTKTSANQKTLGVSWGANSRSSFQRSPFADFGSYMVETNRKLQNQFETEASSSLSSERSVFRGVSIFVDGFTVPSSQELRAYMLNYGGRYENYFSRRRVTHIICSNLPDSKIKNLRSFSGGLPVVKPDWIVDSVAANKLLSWVPYQLEQVACNQPRLSAFFAPKIIQDSDDALRDSSDQVILENVKEIRGIGLQVSKLESVDASKQGLGKSSLKSWLKSAKASTEEQSNIYSVDDGDRVHSDCEDRGTDQGVGPLCEKSLGIRTAVDNHQSSGETSVNQVSAPPPLCHLDLEVIESLPPDLFTELNGIYAGKLVDFVAKHKQELGATSSRTSRWCKKGEWETYIQ